MASYYPESIVGVVVQAWSAMLDAFAGLTGTGIVVRTGAGTATTRAITGTPNQITVTNGDCVAGGAAFSLPSAVNFPGVISATGITDTGNLKVAGAIHLGGDVQGGSTYLTLGHDNLIVAPVTSGFIAGYSPSATVDMVAAGGCTAGVPGVSNPTIAVIASALAAGDIVELSGLPDGDNDGFGEVLSDVAGILTIKGAGVTPTTLPGLRSQLTTAAGAVGTVRKVAITVLRGGTDGIWEVTNGDATPLTFADIVKNGAIATLGALTTTGARTVTVTTKTASVNSPYTLGASVDALRLITNAAFSVLLTAATTGRRVEITCSGGGAFAAALTPNGAETINGAANKVLAGAAREHCVLIGITGIGWEVIG